MSMKQEEPIQYEELKQKASLGECYTDGRFIFNDEGMAACAEGEPRNTDARARLIAHTLNHFDALLEALEAADEEFTKLHYHITTDEFDKASEIVEQALKAAKEVAV